MPSTSRGSVSSDRPVHRGLVLLVSRQLPGTPYCAYGNRVRDRQAQAVVSDSAAAQQHRPIARAAMPTFWDGVAQAFDIRAQHPPYNVLDDKSFNLYVAVLHDWIRYGARGDHIASQHLQGINE